MNTKLVKITTYVCCMLLLIFSIVTTMISPLIARMSEEYDYMSISQTGLLFTMNFIGFTVFILIAGVLAEKFGQKPVLSTSLFLYTIALTLIVFSKSFSQLAVIMFFVGGFGGIIESIVSAIISDINKERTSFYINLSQVFFGIGAIIGPIGFAYLAYVGINWRWAHGVAAAFTLIMAIIFTTLKFKTQPSDTKLNLSTLKTLSKDTNFLLVCLGLFIYTGTEIGGWGWMCEFFKNKLQYNLMMSSITVAVFWIFMTVGRLFCGHLLAKFSERKIIIFLSILSGFITLSAALTQNEMVLWVIIALMGLSYSSQWPLMSAYGSKHTFLPSSAAFSLLVAAGGLGGMVIPYVIGVFGDLVGFEYVMILPAVLIFIPALIFSRFKN